jgi:hypothetical protein
MGHMPFSLFKTKLSLKAAKSLRANNSLVECFKFLIQSLAGRNTLFHRFITYTKFIVPRHAQKKIGLCPTTRHLQHVSNKPLNSVYFELNTSHKSRQKVEKRK